MEENSEYSMLSVSRGGPHIGLHKREKLEIGKHWALMGSQSSFDIPILYLLPNFFASMFCEQ